MIRVQAWNEFFPPKFYGPLTIWPWLRISPYSSLNVIYYLIISARQWLMSFTYTPCIPMQIKPNKSLSRPEMGPALSFTEREAMSCFFLHKISVVPVKLSRLLHNTEDTAGRCLHQLVLEQGSRATRAYNTPTWLEYAHKPSQGPMTQCFSVRS